MSLLPTWVLLVWAGAIAYFDARYRRIPNLLSLGGWLVGGALLVLKQSSLLGGAPSSALWAAGFGLLVTLPAYVLRKLGAGDVKFLVAIGLLTSLPITLNCFVVAALAGALLAFFWLFTHKWSAMVPAALANPQHALGRWLAVPLGERRMAYGALFALGLATSLWMDHHT